MTESNDLAVAIGALEKMSVLAEAAAGYRKKLVDAGVGEASADRMTEEYHSMLIRAAEASVQQGVAQRTRRR